MGARTYKMKRPNDAPTDEMLPATTTSEESPVVATVPENEVAPKPDKPDPSLTSEDLEANEVNAHREHIARAREEMTETIQAIEEKLRPQHLMQEAKESLREAASAKVKEAEQAVENAVDAAREAARPYLRTAEERLMDARDTAREVGTALLRKAQRNPVQAALLGLAVVGLLFVLRRNRPDRQCQ